MRSRCRRSMNTASTPSSAASRSPPTLQPARVASSGSRLAGPQARISPMSSARSACSSERATREWRMSPTTATFSAPKSTPLAWRRLSTSSRPWVGCALRPSPALTTAVPGCAEAASIAAAPSSRWRTMNPRTPMASMLRKVSSAVSPLLVDEVEASKASTSAPSRWAARWNDSRVRVDGSKNRVQAATPASAVRGSAAPSPSMKAWARSSSATRVARGRPSRVSRWRKRPSSVVCRLMRKRRAKVDRGRWRRRRRGTPASVRR